MRSGTAVLCEGVEKYYPIFDSARARFRHLSDYVLRSDRGSGIPTNHFKALSGVTFRLKRGERLGIIGRNGSGKSTLLQLLAGSFEPEKGIIEINGSIYALLPNSIAFDLSLSLEQNARHYLGRLGMSDLSITERIKDIEQFTELGIYFRQPVKNLSTGMLVRGQFAVATAASSDIVVIDEVIGAGDIYWSEKIARRMDSLCQSGVTLILVSHSLLYVNRFCERAIWIERGKQVMDGEAFQVTKFYETFLERLSWQMDDLDDVSVTINDVAEEITDQMSRELKESTQESKSLLLGKESTPEALLSEHLVDSGQLVTKFPGTGDVLISGVWVNGKDGTDHVIGQREYTTFKINLLIMTAGEHSLRLIITFWDELGDRVAIIENERFTINSEPGIRHPLEITLAPNRLIGEECWISLSLFSISKNDSTVDEKSSRLDLISKFLKLRFSSLDKHPLPSRIFKIPMSMTSSRED